MPAIFNFKICDNASACNGIGACPVKAIIWNEEKRLLEIDNSKCTACGACAKACPVEGAICVAATPEEFEKCKEEIENYPMTRAELLEDRYGTEPTDPGLIVNSSNWDNEVLKSNRVVIVDFWDDPHVKCRLHSITYKELLPKEVAIGPIVQTAEGGLKFKFRKIDVEHNSDLGGRYHVETIPSLLIFYNGKEIGRIEGYVKKEEKSRLQSQILTSLKNIGA